jgi:hypothetical protein
MRDVFGHQIARVLLAKDDEMIEELLLTELDPSFLVVIEIRCLPQQLLNVQAVHL